MKILIEFEGKPLLFEHPRQIIRCQSAGGMRDAFDRLEHALRQGLYLAGFLSYEAGYALEERFPPPTEGAFPLLQFGCYDRPRRARPGTYPPPGRCAVNDLGVSIPHTAYADDITTIRDYIRRGEVYQITYCHKLRFSFRGDAYRLYRSLFNAQPVPYPAYLQTDSGTILSLSPEMFLKKNGTALATKPMKGTWPRGRGLAADLRERLRFGRDQKNRAENVMIADLLRNDIGRIGRRVRAPRLFEITPYRTLFQMTSTVTGTVTKDLDIWSLFAALFPSGSVTGAPKIRAMQIIRELEREDRRIYTGAIGYITPRRDLFFNIPIRTILLNGTRAEMGIGGGIVWDSTPDGEWDEGLLKARFLTDLAAAPGEGAFTFSAEKQRESRTR